MVLSQKIKAELTQAMGLGLIPDQKDGRILVRTSRVAATYRVLVDATGELTQAGIHWEDATGEPLLSKKRKGHTFTPNQETVKKGASETIALRNGQQVVVRSWDGSKYKYTATGRRYYAKRKKEYIIEIPVRILGHRSAAERGRTRSRNEEYTRHAYMPVSQFGISQIFANSSMTEAQREKTIKNAVLGKLAYVVNDDGKK
jgi:hypothetical protein